MNKSPPALSKSVEGIMRSHGGAIRISPAEKETAKDILRAMLIHRAVANTDAFVEARNPFANVKSVAHVVDSVLCSASLLVSQVRQSAIRNDLLPNRQPERAFFNAAYARSGNWQTKLHQQLLANRMTHAHQQLQKHASIYAPITAAFPRDATLRKHHMANKERIERLAEMLACIETRTTHRNAFPAAQDADFRMRGLRLQLRGPNRGAPSTKRTQLVGKTDVNGVGLCFWERAKADWVSRVGTNGVRATTVHGDSKCYATRALRLANGIAPFSVQRRTWLFAAH